MRIDDVETSNLPDPPPRNTVPYGDWLLSRILLVIFVGSALIVIVWALR